MNENPRGRLACLAKRILYAAALLVLPGSLIVLPVLWWLKRHNHAHDGIPG